MKFDIIEETLVKDKLIIRCKIELKKYADQKTLIVNTKNVIEKLSHKYQVVEVEKEDEIWNYLRGNRSNYGLWQFKVKQKPEPEPEPKPDPEPEPEPEPEPKPEPEPESEPEPRPKKDFRKRFRNLAKTKKD